MEFGPALRTVGLATLAGGALSLTGIPLAWMIGAMVATVLTTLSGAAVKLPVSIQYLVRALVGTMIGSAITLELVASFSHWWLSLVGLMLALAIMFCTGYLLLRRIGGFTPPSAALCAVPGGIAEMILLADKAGADQTRVSIVHALRIALTILIMPLVLGLFGWDGERPDLTTGDFLLSGIDWVWLLLCVVSGLLAHRFTSLPAPLVLVPLVTGSLLHLTGLTSFEMPGYLTVAVQIFIGINVGSRFAGMSARALAQALGMAILVVAVQIATASIIALVFVSATGGDPLAQLLAYAPGGLAEMSLIAVAVDTDPAFVGLHHMIRVLIALLVAPGLLGLLSKRR